MFSNLDDYISSLMINIPKGKTRLRDFREEQKWISSNYQFAMPGRRKNLKKVVWDVAIEPFYLAKYPVTEELYSIITRESFVADSRKPVVNVSWIDAVNFCNLLSEKFNFQKYYEIDKKITKLFTITDRMVFVYPQMLNGNMHVRQIQKDTDMGKSIK